ncbi:MAG TPA: Glu/Leu/Phe/Val dehydrogenase [Candidatus Limnocylindria bacterium]|nr:Glu/Leu/Phe/Val dehydrogenase [Candidatus Limnocylindria bacterium]
MTNRNPATNGAQLWAAAQAELDQVADRLGLDDGMHRVLRLPKRELEVHFPIRFDDGRVDAATGWRVHHNINRGPSSGGVRFTADLTLDLVRANAMWNTWKAAIVEIPYGGAFGGVVINPKRLSTHELEGLTRRYTTEISPIIGPAQDIPMPDVNTDEQTMAWMMDTYSMHRGYTIRGVVTGKPPSIGGTRGQREAVSLGALRAIQAVARQQDVALDGARVVVQGFGRVGTILAEMLAGVGARIVAIADDRHAVRNPSGIEVAPAMAHMAEHDSAETLPGGEPMEREDIFGEPCDILVSAGLQGQISEGNAGMVKARIVAEAANGATSPEADRALFDNGVTVIPDLLCTAGGFVVGYFEWVQDLQSFFWSDAEVTAELERVMDDAAGAVMAAAERHKVDLRTAALMVGIGRAAEATTLRGLYP